MLELDIVRIGNSKGIRIPSSLLKQCGIDNRVKVEIHDGSIVLKALKTPREGWAAIFQSMHHNDDDKLIVSNDLDNHLLEEWDDD
jgi:antitoxin MazE